MVITTVVNPQDLNTDTFSTKTELKIYIRKEQDTAKLLLSPIALATARDELLVIHKICQSLPLPNIRSIQYSNNLVE